MTQRLEVFHCEVCGNVVEVLHGAAGTLVCCGQPMERVDENTVDAAREKHVPVVEAIDGGIKVKIGSVPHPMEDAHYIEWIQVNQGDRSYRKYLNAGDAPEATFPVAAEEITVRGYCNLHGIWRR